MGPSGWFLESRDPSSRVSPPPRTAGVTVVVGGGGGVQNESRYALLDSYPVGGRSDPWDEAYGPDAKAWT